MDGETTLSLPLLVDELAAIKRQVDLAADRPDRERKQEILKTRKRLAQAMNDLSAFGYAENFGPSGDPAVQAEVRQRISKLRSAVCDHQARWPVVMSDAKESSYWRSASNMTEALDEFIGWARNPLAVKA